MLKGSIDAVHNGHCHGWAMDPETPASIEVELFVDGKSIGRGFADRYRADLEQAGLRDGRLAFSIRVPEALHDGREHLIEMHSIDGRVITARENMRMTPGFSVAEFERGAPWIDRDEAMFEATLAALCSAGGATAEDASNLRFFREHGWLVLEQAVPHALIDAVLDDVESAWRDLPPQLVWRRGLDAPVRMDEMARESGFREASVRYLDFHNASEAAAEIMMLPAALHFAELCFGEKIAAMQTLLFENGTQQTEHQDFAYVHSLRPACLMGAWVAMEDVRAEAGPLFYWDRSHRKVPKYVFEDGTVIVDGYGPQVQAFSGYLEKTCRERGLERLVFTPRKGDLLLWHSALVHGGMPRNNPALSRRSMVSHYTTQAAYPYDRRAPNEPPLRIERNGGVYYGACGAAHIENRYPLEVPK
ncbi:MAG TPA: phytanoyl-CoA dioxygenase family protein [Rhodanobacteraceae bacterium]|jgi:hypothetical protein|nr:phytanoyl-CoA dioxygenase family protein [Rhodanobacteraceae bacterium]